MLRMTSAISAGNLDTSPPSVHLILSQRKRKRKILNTPCVIVATNSSQREHSNGTRKIVLLRDYRANQKILRHGWASWIDGDAFVLARNEE